MATLRFISRTVKTAEAGTLLPAWADLAMRALVPAGYGGHELLLPILAQDQHAGVETVWQNEQLVLACASVQGRLLDRSLSSPLIASGLPQVDGECREAAMAAFLDGRRKPFLFKAVPSQGLFAELLQSSAAHLVVLKKWQRAGLEISGSHENWLALNFDHKRRKELKRQRARLAERGEFKLETLNHISALLRFIENLLELEAKGWKGARGTALQNDKALETAFRAGMHNLAAAGKLRFWCLTLDGKAVAALFAIVEGDEAWLGKIAYDEAFAKYSPGTLIVLDATESLFGEGAIRRADSSAIPGHPMIDRIWRDRIGFEDVLVAGSDVTPLGFWLVARGLLAIQAIRAIAKKLFYFITKRKRS